MSKIQLIFKQLQNFGFWTFCWCWGDAYVAPIFLLCSPKFESSFPYQILVKTVSLNGKASVDCIAVWTLRFKGTVSCVFLVLHPVWDHK
jgi:hypothetical protein